MCACTFVCVCVCVHMCVRVHLFVCVCALSSRLILIGFIWDNVSVKAAGQVGVMRCDVM